MFKLKKRYVAIPLGIFLFNILKGGKTNKKHVEYVKNSYSHIDQSVLKLLSEEELKKRRKMNNK